MDLKLLDHFITVYQTGSITAAARELDISQQGLSKSIQNLERELDLPLFLREKNRLQPTSFGDLFYTQVLHLTGEFQKMLDMMEDARKGAATLKIGFATNIFSALNEIETAIWRFRKLNPGILVEISNETDLVCEEEVEKGGLDVAFGMGSFFSPDIRSHYLAEESIYALVPDTHPLASRELLYISDICEEPLIISDKKNKGYFYLKEDFQKKGLLPRIAFWSDDPQTHFRLVQKRMGISLFPEHWISLLSNVSDLKVIPLADISKRKIYVIYKKQGRVPPALKDFLRFIFGPAI